MPRWLPWTLCGLLCALLGLRVWTLESRVQAMQGRVEKLRGPVVSAPTTVRDTPASPQLRAAPPTLEAPDAGAAQRAMLAELQRLREDLASLQRATSATPTLDDLDRASDDARILDAVQKRNQKVLDRQLEFHRQSWLELRQRAATDFASALALDPDQTHAIKDAVAREVDAMVELLARPGTLADPGSVAGEWRQALVRTDARAEDVLDEGQLRAWQHLRAQERATLWPWLDDAPAEGAAAP